MLMRGEGRALDFAVDGSAFSMAIHKFYTLFKLGVEQCHCLVTQQPCVSASPCWIPKHQWILFLFLPCFPSLRSVCCSDSSRSSGVRKEGSRSWDESRGHLHTHWQEREGWSRKIKKFLSLKRKNERKNKKRKRSGAKIFALSPPKFDVFSVRMCCFFSLEVTEKV